MAYDDIIQRAADTYGLDPNFIKAQMRQESGGKRNAMSNKGASGLMQLMPATARELGVTDIFDPEQNIMGGAKYLKQQLDKYGSPEIALAAYNAGPGAVQKYGGIPPYRETQNYVKRIMGNYARLAGDAVTGLGNAMIKPARADETPYSEQDYLSALEQVRAKKQQQPEISEGDYLKALAQVRASKQKPYSPLDDMSTTDKVLAGVGGAMMDTAQGAGQMVGLVSPEDVAEKRRLDAPLLDTTEGKIGNVAGNVATFLPTAMIPGANTMKGASLIGAGIGALQPATSEGEVLSNAALGAGANAAGVKLGNMIGAAKPDIVPEIAKKSIDKGLVIPPTQVKPSFKNRLLEGFSGKITTAQNASAKNQEVFNAMAKKAIGADDLTQEGLSVVKATANKSYDELAQSKPFIVDKAFKSALNDAANRTAKFKADFPALKNFDVDELISSLSSKKKFNADTTVEAVKRLRQDASANKSSMDASKKELGRVQQKVANALEDLIERNLSGSNPELLGKFKEARKTLAKTYDISKAADSATGNINANKLAQIMQKNPNRLTGELKDIAEFAQMYPKASQNVSKMGSLPQSSPLDWALSSLLSAGTGNIGMMAGVMARPAARKYILSKGAQNALVKAVSPKGLGRTSKALLSTMPAALINARE
jgi:hypothetical protein